METAVAWSQPGAVPNSATEQTAVHFPAHKLVHCCLFRADSSRYVLLVTAAAVAVVPVLLFCYCAIVLEASLHTHLSAHLAQPALCLAVHVLTATCTSCGSGVSLHLGVVQVVVAALDPWP